MAAMLVCGALMWPAPVWGVELGSESPGGQNNGPRVRNPKLATLLDDVARSVPQDRSPLRAGLRIAPPANFAPESLLKSVRDAMRSRFLRIDPNAEVQVYVLLSATTDANLQALAAAGARIEVEDRARRRVQARIPVTRLDAVADLPVVDWVRLPSYAVPLTGSVETEGDSILEANLVRQQLQVDGTGVNVGVLSDGIKGIFAAGCTTCQGATGGPISTGDLPNATGTRNSSDVLTSSSGGIIGQPFTSDDDLEGLPQGSCGFAGAGAEGTAMLEIVHDLAPGAQLFFANADTSITFMQAVNYLAGQADVVVDDLGFFGEPYDGTSDVSSNTARALNNANNPIRAYFTAVGNAARTHYQEQYVDSGVDGRSIVGASGRLHLFQSTASTSDVLGLGPSPYDVIELPAGGEVVIILTWDDPWGSSQNNYDLYLVQASTGAVVARSTDVQNGTQEPAEGFVYTNDTGSDDTFHIIVQNVNNQAAVKTLQMFLFAPECATAGPESLAPTHEKHNYNTVAHSVPAESDAGGSPVSVTSLGAICSASAGAQSARPSDESCFDATNSTIEYFSSIGPTFDGRMKPDVTGIDGVSVTGAGQFENPFFGTSAAAPHGAGVAALLLQTAPCLLSDADGAADPTTARRTLRNLILNNAVDLGALGPDNVFGYGRVDALAAALQTVPSAASVANQTVSGNVPNGATLSAAALGFTDPDNCPLTLNWSGGCGSGSGASLTCPFGTNNVTVQATNNGATLTTATTVEITVTNFTVAVSPPSESATAGGSASFTVTVGPQPGPFTSAITLGCGNLPSLTRCSFVPAALTPGSTNATSALTVTTTAASARLAPPGDRRAPPPYAILAALISSLVLALIACCLAARNGQRRRLAWLVPLAVVLSVMAIHVACGGGGGGSPPPSPGTPAGTYTISINGTAGSLVNSTTARLTVH